jgi:NADH-quinone oxidoreductase subunit J
MMLDINTSKLRDGFVNYLPIAIIVGILILIEMIFVVAGWPEISAPEITTTTSNTALLGTVLYTSYVYPFEIAAAILLVAMIAAIALTMRPHTNAKYQKPEEQVKVQSKDRLKIIKMPTEPKD